MVYFINQVQERRKTTPFKLGGANVLKNDREADITYYSCQRYLHISHIVVILKNKISVTFFKAQKDIKICVNYGRVIHGEDYRAYLNSLGCLLKRTPTEKFQTLKFRKIQNLGII